MGSNYSSRRTTYSSRRTTTSASSYSAMGQAASSSAAAAEAARLRRIAELKKFGDSMTKARDAVSNVAKKFSNFQTAIGKNLTGSAYNEVASVSKKATAQFNITVNGLNACVENVEGKIRGEGEKFTFLKSKLPTMYTNYTSKNPSTFYCDTEKLRSQRLPELKNMKKDLEKALSEISNTKVPTGCQDTKEVENELKRLLKSVNETYDATLKTLNAAEKAEAESLKVIDRFASSYGATSKTTTLSQQQLQGTTQTGSPLYLDMFPKNVSSIINAQTQKDSIKALGNMYGIDTKGKTLQEVYNEATVKFLAKENKIDTKNKTDREIMEAVAKKLGISTTFVSTVKTTKNVPNTFGKFPILNQLDYYYVGFGKSNVRLAGCEPTSFSMLVAGAINDPTFNPERLMNENADLNLGQYYSKETGGQDGLIRNEELLNRYNLEYNGNYHWQEAFVGLGKYEQGRLVEDLKKGNAIIWRTDNSNGNNIFTGSGHYLLITGITDDGKILVNDPNGANYMSNNKTLQNGLTEGKGFDIGVIASCGGDFYSYSVKNVEPTTVTSTVERQKSDQTLMSEIGNKYKAEYSNTTTTPKAPDRFSTTSNASTSSDFTKTSTVSNSGMHMSSNASAKTSTVSNSGIHMSSNASYKIPSYANGYDPANLPDKSLFDADGINYFYQNGKYIKETFSADSLKNSYDLKLLILELGYDPGYWVREDGVQMCGNDVMYAANIAHWNGENPTNSTYKRGDKWYGSSGPGRIVGLASASEAAAEGKITDSLGNKVDVWYNTYTQWWDGGKYQQRYYSKDSQYSTSNVIYNAPEDPSKRYYQTNQSWEDFFKAYPSFRPEGTENVTDWEEYFQRNNDPSKETINEKPTTENNSSVKTDTNKVFKPTTKSNSSTTLKDLQDLLATKSNSSTTFKDLQDALTTKSNSSAILKELQKLENANNTNIERMADIPYLSQYDSQGITYCGGNLQDNGCGIYAASAIVMYLTNDLSKTPEYLAKKYGDWNNKNDKIDYDSLMSVAVTAIEAEGIKTTKTFDFKDVQKALAEGKPVLALESKVFTNKPSHHFVSYLGLNENGNVEVRDSNSYNWNRYEDWFKNGFPEEEIQYAGSGYWICELEETE